MFGESAGLAPPVGGGPISVGTKAITGSTLVALRAGKNDAASATSSSVIDTAIDHWLRGIHFKQCLLHQPRHDQRAGETEGDPDQCETTAVAEHHPHHRSRWCAQCHPQADLAAAARHQVSHHAVDTETREDERKHRKAAQQHEPNLRFATVCPIRAVNASVQQRQIRINRA